MTGLDQGRGLRGAPILMAQVCRGTDLAPRQGVGVEAQQNNGRARRQERLGLGHCVDYME